MHGTFATNYHYSGSGKVGAVQPARRPTQSIRHGRRIDFGTQANLETSAFSPPQTEDLQGSSLRLDHTKPDTRALTGGLRAV